MGSETPGGGGSQGYRFHWFCPRCEVYGSEPPGSDRRTCWMCGGPVEPRPPRIKDASGTSDLLAEDVRLAVPYDEDRGPQAPQAEMACGACGELSGLSLLADGSIRCEWCRRGEESPAAYARRTSGSGYMNPG